MITSATQESAVATDGSGDSLPFSKPKQMALIGHFFVEGGEKFFAQCRHKVKAEWWSDPRAAQIWTMALDFAEQYGRAPKNQELAESPVVMRMDNKEQIQLRSFLSSCLKTREDIGVDTLKCELTDWLHARIYLSAMKRSEAMFNAATRSGGSKRFQEAYLIMQAMNKEIADTSFEDGQAEDMQDAHGDFVQAQVDAQTAISFGLDAFDRLLLPEGGGNGSLLKGDMTVLLAPTNIGKTTTMVTVAVHNIMNGKDVLLVTHEGRISDIKMKIWQCMLQMDRKSIMSKLGSMREAFAFCQEITKKHLEFLPLNKAGLTVEDVEVILTRRNDRWKSDHGGKGFDLVVDDYAAKLTTQYAKGGQWALRQIHEVVYNYFTQMALSLNTHVITAIQTNREGSKVNRKTGSKEQNRLLTMEDVMESWGPMTTATNVISINRDPVAQAKGIVTFFICKSRSSEVGWAIACKSNYAAATSHGQGMPATWYKGVGPMSEKIDTLLEGYVGKEIPFEEIRKLDN